MIILNPVAMFYHSNHIILSVFYQRTIIFPLFINWNGKSVLKTLFLYTIIFLLLRQKLFPSSISTFPGVYYHITIHVDNRKRKGMVMSNLNLKLIWWYVCFNMSHTFCDYHANVVSCYFMEFATATDKYEIYQSNANFLQDKTKPTFCL